MSTRKFIERFVYRILPHEGEDTFWIFYYFFGLEGIFPYLDKMVVMRGGVREEFPGLVVMLGMVIEIDAVVHGPVAVDVLYCLFGTDDRALLDEFNHGRASIACRFVSWVMSI